MTSTTLPPSLYVCPMPQPWVEGLALPNEALLRVNQITHPTRRAQSAWARYVLTQALEARDETCLAWMETPPGPPTLHLQHASGAQYTIQPCLAHTHNWVGVALPGVQMREDGQLISIHPLFMDMESVQPRRASLESLITHTWGESTWHLLNECAEPETHLTHFYEAWGVHEAVIKAKYAGYHLAFTWTPPTLEVYDTHRQAWGIWHHTIPQHQDILVTTIAPLDTTCPEMKACYAKLDPTGEHGLIDEIDSWRV